MQLKQYRGSTFYQNYKAKRGSDNGTYCALKTSTEWKPNCNFSLIMIEALKMVIIGGGEHARVMLDILTDSGNTEILGYTDPAPSPSMEIPYLGADDALMDLSSDSLLLINGIGSVELPRKRQLAYMQLTKKGFRFGRVIHRAASISSKANLAEGVQVIGASVINTGAIINENCIINTSAVVDHDCRIGAHSHIGPGVVLSGKIRIGEGCHIGTGSVVIQGINIGDGVLIGAGSLVVSDIPSGATAYGSPARVINSA